MANGFGDFNPIFVFVVFALVWLVFFGYAFYIARRLGDVRADLDALKRELGEKNETDGPDGA